MKKQKILNISSVKYSGNLYNLHLQSEDECDDDLFWIEQNSKILSHNCFPKDLNSFINWGKQNNCFVEMCEAANKVNLRIRPDKDWEKVLGATTKTEYRKEE